MPSEVSKRLSILRGALSAAANGLSPAEWYELLGEIDADIQAHLEAVKEENPELR